MGKRTLKNTFGKLLSRAKVGSTAGLKKLINKEGNIEIDYDKYNVKELKKIRDILNAEANRRLEVAKNNINKKVKKGKTINEILGNDIADIYEFNPAESGRIGKLKSGEYGVRSFIIGGRNRRDEIIRDIVERTAFLNKKTSTIKGFKEMKKEQEKSYNTFVLNELQDTLGYKPTKADLKKFNKLIERLKTDKYIFRQKDLNVRIIGTDSIVQTAVRIVKDEEKLRNIDIDYIITKIEYKADLAELRAKYERAKVDISMNSFTDNEAKRGFERLKRGYEKDKKERTKKYEEDMKKYR